MIVFPHAKINLGLHVTGKENTPGGYHTIETIMFPVGLYDALEAIPAPDNAPCFKQSGLPLPDDGKDNLCLRVLGLARKELSSGPGNKDREKLPPLHIHLHKKIPAGAGLGGGSADAAHMLMLLNERFDLNFSHETLTRMAGRLGSDCPFFLQRQPMLATGRGDILQTLTGLSLQGYNLVIVCPPVHVSTAEAYRMITPAEPAINPAEVIRKPVEKWQGELVNNFEPLISQRHPEVAEAKKRLLASGAVYASMSGSGSAVYGIFNTPPPLNELKAALPACHIVQASAGVS